MFSQCPTGEKYVILLETFMANIPKAIQFFTWGITACDQWHKVIKLTLWEKIQVLYAVVTLQQSPLQVMGIFFFL